MIWIVVRNLLDCMIKLRNDHTVLGLCARNEGTNIGTGTRVLLFHLYIVTILAVSALFYGKTTNSVC